MNLAWWALAVLEALGLVWLLVLGAGYLRLRKLLRDIEQKPRLDVDREVPEVRGDH